MLTLKFKNDFAKNLLILVSGTTMAQALPILITPFLTRIYTPEDFGALALYVALVSILSSIACGRYEVAIVLPSKDKDVFSIFWLSNMIALGFSLLLLLIIIIFHKDIIEILDAEKIGKWIYVIPLSVFLMSINNSFGYLKNRFREYKVIASVSVIKSVCASVTQLISGVAKVGVSGLFFGVVVQGITGLIGYSTRNSNFKKKYKSLSKARIYKNALIYKKLPMLGVLSTLVNSLYLNMNNIMVNLVYGISIGGFYAVANRVLGVPITIIGNSVGQIYLEKASAEKNKTGSCEIIYRNFLSKMLFFGGGGVSLGYLVVEDLLAMALGEEWRISGYYAKLMLPLFLFRFAVGPLSITLSIFNRQGLSLFWNLLQLITYLSVFYFGSLYKAEFEVLLEVLVVLSSINYCLLAFIVWRVATGKSLTLKTA